MNGSEVLLCRVGKRHTGPENAVNEMSSFKELSHVSAKTLWNSPLEIAEAGLAPKFVAQLIVLSKTAGVVGSDLTAQHQVWSPECLSGLKSVD